MGCKSRCALPIPNAPRTPCWFLAQVLDLASVRGSVQQGQPCVLEPHRLGILRHRCRLHGRGTRLPGQFRPHHVPRAQDSS